MPNAVGVAFVLALVSRVLVTKYDAIGCLQRQHLPRGPMTQEQVDLINILYYIILYYIILYHIIYYIILYLMAHHYRIP